MDQKKIMAAIVALRDSMKLTQTAFAQQKLHKTLSTQQRYEGVRPPPREVLVELVYIAREHGQTELAELFKAAAAETIPKKLRDLLTEPTNASIQSSRKRPA